VADALGNPLRLRLSAGNEADISHAPPLLCTLPLKGSVINADKGYDSQSFVDWLTSMGALPNIPGRETNKVKRECDWWLYKERRLIECFWNKIKQFRRVATRYDKYASTFLGFVYLASVLVLLK
jgi:transposase